MGTKELLCYRAHWGALTAGETGPSCNITQAFPEFYAGQVYKREF